MNYPIAKSDIRITYPIQMLRATFMKRWARRLAREYHYVPGEKVTSLDELMACDRVIFVGNGRCKPYIINYGWYQNWQIRMAHTWVKRGWLARAVSIRRSK